MKTEVNVYQQFVKDTLRTINEINQHQNLGITEQDKKAIQTFGNENHKAIVDKISALLDEVKEDVKKANFGLQSKTFTTLQNSVFSVSYKHANVVLAKYLLQSIGKQVN